MMAWKFRGRLSLRALFVLAVTGVVIATSGLLGWVLTSDRAEREQRELEARGITLARLIASPAEYGVMVGDREGLERLLGGLKADADVAYVAVADLDGSILAHGAQELLPALELQLSHDSMNGNGSAVRRIQSDGQSWLWIEVPVQTIRRERSREDFSLDPVHAKGGEKPETVGTVQLLMSMKRVDEAIAEAWQLVLAISALVVLLGAGLAVPIANLVVGPVRTLASATISLARGELPISVSENSPLELSELSRAFNHMVASLHDRDSRIAENAAELERRAEVLRIRQAELETANDQLSRLNQELKLSQEQLGESNEELLRGMDLKSVFMASVSHELRTPLNSIIGYTECLLDELDGPVLPEQRESLERVRRNGRHLLQLINEILDFSRIEAGRMELQSAFLDPAALVEECLLMVRPLVQGRQLDLTWLAFAPVEPVLMDVGRVRQVLINLISNAVKFTEAGTVRVEVGGEAQGVRFNVCDTGPGIPIERVSEIFMPFRRLHGPEVQGTGLGLAITQRLIERMAGTIQVRPNEPVGSIFSVWLPPLQAELSAKTGSSVEGMPQAS